MTEAIELTDALLGQPTQRNVLPVRNREATSYRPPPTDREKQLQRDLYCCAFFMMVFSIAAVVMVIKDAYFPKTTRFPLSTTHLNGNITQMIITPAKPFKRFDIVTSKAACWPSTTDNNGGGDAVWIKTLTGVEADFIGLDRFNDAARSSDTKKEDVFCAKLRKLGAQRYKLPTTWPTDCAELDSCVDPVEPVQLALGFTGNWTDDGGLWMLDTMTMPAEMREPIMAALDNASSMKERCTLIERLGGKFCSDFKACDETAKLVG